MTNLFLVGAGVPTVPLGLGQETGPSFHSHPASSIQNK
jgi:hypothetical protein